MRIALAAALAVALLVGGPLRAGPQEKGFEEVLLRVTSSGPGAQVVVDRGSGDGLAEGDPVQFLPRDGRTSWGTVQRADERSALVRLVDPSVVPPVGTRGRVRIPAERLDAAGAPLSPVAPAEGLEHPPWQNEDSEWSEGEPLLAQVDAVRPEERRRRVTGRIYALGDATTTSDAGRADSFLRAGTSLHFENPFGRGGGLDLDGEVNYRTTELPDAADEAEGRLRVDRLSWYFGGNRFEPDRWQMGRFLQHGMPEFGVVDGVEWTRRLERGDSFGVSAGFMPLPNPDYQSGQDLQFAAHYRWVADEDERLTAAAGFQKTYAETTIPDRDLLVTRLDWMPPAGWDFHGSLWIDFYGASDDNKDTALELTRAWLSTQREFEGGARADLTYYHQAYPELVREELPPVGTDTLADAHVDRMVLTGWHPAGADSRWRGIVGGWVDESDAGGDAELGLEVEGLMAAGSRSDLALFGSLGKFSSALGGRLAYGQDWRLGRWDLFYELADMRQYGFSPDNDDVVQHRLRASTSWFSASGWSLSAYAQGLLFSHENAVTAGFHLQRSF